MGQQSGETGAALTIYALVFAVLVAMFFAIGLDIEEKTRNRSEKSVESTGADSGCPAGFSADDSECF